MKKKLCLALTCMLMIACLLPAAAEGTTETQAWAQIFTFMESETGYTQQQLHKGQIVYENSVWAFSVIVKEPPADEDGLFVGQMDASGVIEILQYPEKITLDQQLASALKSCFNRDDCYLLLAEVHAQWAPIIQALSEEQLSQIFESYSAVIRLDIRVPDAGAIAYAEAYDKALQHLSIQPGWSVEQANLFWLAISAYYTPTDIGRPVFFFYFETHSRFEAAYSTEQAQKKYRAVLTKAFGGEAPQCFSIMVDAMNGDLVEPPVFDYAPVKYHYLDFLIRTEELIRDVKGQ